MAKGKAVGLAIFGLILVAIILAVVWPKDPKSNLETMTVAKGDVVQTVEVTGAVTYPETRRVAFMTSGRLDSLKVKAGDVVEAGQLLAMLENPTPEIVNDVLRLPSPIDGIVTAVYAQPGEVVAVGSPVMLVQGPNREFQITMQVPENDVTKLFIGDDVAITFDAIDGVTFTGDIVTMAPVATDALGAVTYAVVATIDGVENGEKGAFSMLRAGLTADVNVITAEAKNVVSVPRRAIVTRDGASYVRVVVDNIEGYEERLVSTGLRGDNGDTVIVNGLSEGEEIVLKIVE